MISNGFVDWRTFSKIGSSEWTDEIFELTIRMYGSSRTASSRS